MRDIIKDYGKSETEKRERGVLDEYAEMCRYQNERQRKSNEDFSDKDLYILNQLQDKCPFLFSFLVYK